MAAAMTNPAPTTKAIRPNRRARTFIRFQWPELSRKVVSAHQPPQPTPKPTRVTDRLWPNGDLWRSSKNGWLARLTGSAVHTGAHQEAPNRGLHLPTLDHGLNLTAVGIEVDADCKQERIEFVASHECREAAVERIRVGCAQRDPGTTALAPAPPEPTASPFL